MPQLRRFLLLSAGTASAEVPRRALSDADLREILRAQVSEHAREADAYQALGRADAAERLRARARTLALHLD